MGGVHCAAVQVGRDAAAVTHSVADVAASRWARLVAGRTASTPRLKLYEFQVRLGRLRQLERLGG